MGNSQNVTFVQLAQSKVLELVSGITYQLSPEKDGMPVALMAERLGVAPELLSMGPQAEAVFNWMLEKCVGPRMK